MLTALQAKDYDLAFQIWHEIVTFEDLRAKYDSGNNVVIIKEAMNMVGLNAGITREPVAPLNDQDRKETYELMARWGFQPKLTIMNEVIK